MNKKRISLQKQIIFMVLLPLAAFVFALGNRAKTAFTRYQHNSEVVEHLEIIQYVSDIVDGLQVERGLSTAYINGTNNYGKLVTHRESVDEKILKFKEMVNKGSVSKDEIFDSYFVELEKINEYRSWVDEKNEVGVHLKNYKTVIYSLLSYYSYTAEFAEDLGISSEIMSLRVLEEGKENLGKLRANLSGVFAKNTPMSDENRNTIINLHTGVMLNLKSPLVHMTEKNQKVVEGFYSQSNFRAVDEKYELALKLADEGNYNVNVDQFFVTISSSVSNISSVIKRELDALKVDLNEVKMTKEKYDLVKLLSLSIAVFSLISFISISMIKRINSLLKKLIKNLNDSYEVVSREAKGLAESSIRLAELSTENSSAIQETASSVEEISSMVRNNVNEAEKSKGISDEANSASIIVGQKMTELTDSMKGIVKSNNEIEGLIRIFDEIGEKTKIIDDIVFQTKILSFNASVEAERAGEHGRGFSVVASEVSNLALLSGKAATEISSIVKESIKSAEKVASENKEKVMHGNEILVETTASIGKIIENLEKINKTADQILISSKDQADGIEQVNQAIAELELATQQNVSLADHSSLSGKELEMQANELGKSITSLSELVKGDGNDSESIYEEDKNEENKVVELKVVTQSTGAEVVKMVSGSDVNVSTNDEAWSKI